MKVGISGGLVNDHILLLYYKITRVSPQLFVTSNKKQAVNLSVHETKVFKVVYIALHCRAS